jgi:hypothetical protein
MFGKKSTGETIADSGKKAAKNVEKATKKADKAAKTALANADKAAVKNQPANIVETLTRPRTARRAMRVVKIAGPVLAPFALEAATATRGFLDERRAIKLGVTAEEVAAYRGPTGATAARIASLRSAVDELRRRRTTDLQVTRFADVARARLADLNTAVHTASSMPTSRRRSTLHAVGKELNQIEADLMTFLVGRPV